MTIQDIKQQLAALAPLSDAAIQAQVDAGADASELLAVEAEKETQRRALQFQLNSLEKKQAESEQLQAKKELDALEKQREKAKAQAQAAINRLPEVVELLRKAMAEFQVAAGDYAALSQDAHRASRKAGVSLSEQGRLHPIVQPFEKQMLDAIQPYRRPKFFDEQAVEVIQ